MSIVLRLFIALISCLLLWIVMRDLVRRKLTEVQSLFWIILSLGMLLVAALPDGVYLIAQFFRVEYAPSIWFALAVIAALFGIFSCYRTNADLLRRVNELSIQISLLKDQVQRLEGKGDTTTDEGK